MEDKSQATAKDGNHAEYKTLTILGETYKTYYTKKYENRKKWKKTDPKIIIANIPGLILEVFTKEGDQVIAGENMLVLEAMKMKNLFTYPLSGTIKAVYVEAGDCVPKGFVMLEYE